MIRPSRMRSPGRKPILRRIIGPAWRESAPSTVACPEVGRMMSSSARMVVVFPAPLGPMTPKTLPRGTVKLTSRSAWVRPKVLLRPTASIAWSWPPP